MTESPYPLAFSTLGIPGRPLAEALELAAAHGYAGLELRCHDEEPVHTGLDRTARAAVARAFTQAGIAPLTVASYVRVAAPGDDADIDSALREHVELAADIGAPFVRVFPGARDDPPAVGDERAVRRLAAIAPFAANLGVRVLLETHDSHGSALAASRVLSHVDPRGTGVIWDTMHTHLAGDTPDEAVRLLAPHLGYVQVKDIAGPDDRTPLALGAGSLPLEEALRALTAVGYRGWLAWEYEARWFPAAAPLPPQLAAGRAWLARRRAVERP
jgi:sugar phosphate isomerase/epimerase